MALPPPTVDVLVVFGVVAAAIALFYLLTGLLANVITPVASVVLMLPIAIDAAVSIGADPFAFVLGVTFAASTAFMTPIGYQTNLMIYSAGGYRFTDFIRVGGAPPAVAGRRDAAGDRPHLDGLTPTRRPLRRRRSTSLPFCRSRREDRPTGPRRSPCDR